MSRTHILAIATLAAFSAGASAAIAGDAQTVRIEPRPFYGATVTLEAGVRVFRPLPPQKYVIINPDNRTPLSLSLSEVNKTSNNYNHNYNHGDAPSGDGAHYGGSFFDGGARRHGGARSNKTGAYRPGHAGGGHGGRGGGHGGRGGGGFVR
ncbi:MAG: hypothetical protein RLZ98_795 [Pseudomonadota bacterium]|jgi:hypothetical protein